MTVIYADVLFAVNFSMDFIALCLTGRILHIKNSPFRLISAASIGGIYGVAAVVMTVGRLIGILSSVIFCSVLCAVAFGVGNGRKFLLSLPIFFLSGAALSGVMTALIAATEPMTNSDGGEEVTPIAFGIAALAAAVITFLAGRVLKRNAATKTVQVTVTYGEKRICVTGIVDSGNLLSDPLSGRSVILLSEDRAMEIFGGEIFALSQSGHSEYSPSEQKLLRRTRLIPADGIGGRRLLTGIRPDRVEILCKRKRREVDAIVATDAGVSSYGGEEALVPEALL